MRTGLLAAFEEFVRSTKPAYFTDPSMFFLYVRLRGRKNRHLRRRFYRMVRRGLSLVEARKEMKVPEYVRPRPAREGLFGPA